MSAIASADDDEEWEKGTRVDEPEGFSEVVLVQHATVPDDVRAVVYETYFGVPDGYHRRFG